MSECDNTSPPPAVAGDERRELELLRRALVASGDVAYSWDFKSDAVIWSANAHRVLGFDESTNISDRSSYICRVNGADLPTLSCVQENRHLDGTAYQMEYRLRRSDGGFCWVQDHGVVECNPDDNSDESLSGRAVGLIRVITERKEKEARLEWLTNHDEVTGHYNRICLRDLLDHTFAYSGRYDSPGAYLSVAIDDYAIISDTFGEENMDRAVIAVGQALDKCLRACDVVGRVSPDQFGVILSNCPSGNDQVISERILEAVMQANVATPDGTIRMTVSIGGVSFPKTVRAPHDAVIKADIALSRARRNGQNCYVSYNLTEEQRNDSRRTLSIAKEIQTALQDDGLTLAFQPIVSGKDYHIESYECLLRIRGGDGYLPTGPALGIAESMGLIRTIDQRVLVMAVKELEVSKNVTLAINISGLTTTEPSWLRSLIALVGNRPDLAQRLVVEITETAALEDMEEAVRFVSAVRNLGCRVALDDFGAGYTSFRHLKTLAVDIVKIDGSFVLNLASRPEDFLFIKSLLELASGFGLVTVAECVEDAEVADLLSRQGVDLLQGYYFGKPSFERPWQHGTVRREATGGAIILSPDFRPKR
jgi:diguanylate cyclase (GGDEF)-like protein